MKKSTIKSKKVKARSSSNFFKNTFVGEMVEILTDMSIYNPAVQASMPMPINGYVLEIDDEYIYLGNTGTEIDAAIKMVNVKSIEIIKEKTQYDKILEDLPTDEDNAN